MSASHSNPWPVELEDVDALTEWLAEAPIGRSATWWRGPIAAGERQHRPGLDRLARWRATAMADRSLVFHRHSRPARIWAVAITRDGLVWSEAEIVEITRSRISVVYKGVRARCGGRSSPSARGGVASGSSASATGGTPSGSNSSGASNSGTCCPRI